MKFPLSIRYAVWWCWALVSLFLSPMAFAAAKATGGETWYFTENGTNFVAHIFPTNDTFVVDSAITADILIVGGGGGGGGRMGGGGGGGGVVHVTGASLPSGSYPVTVGLGGSGGYQGNRGSNGSSSMFSNAVAIGGGGGGHWADVSGLAGASGGGAGGPDSGLPTGGVATVGSTLGDFSAGTVYTGNRGGNITITRGGGGGSGDTSGRGGGGAGTAASDGPSAAAPAGPGGDGVVVSILGIPYYWAGGGGGGAYGNAIGGAGGLGGGGGGAGSSYNGGTGGAGMNYGDGGNSGSATPGGAGGANTGGGGGGAAYDTGTGGKGGDGVVIVRYERLMIQDFTKKMQITFTGYTKNELLTNFPVLVIFSNGMANGTFLYSDFPTNNGAGLQFVGSDETTPVPHEIQQWNTNGLSYLWVRVPVLTNNASVWAYYGCDSATRPAYATAGAVWSNGYIGVWHMDTDPSGTIKDSTAHRYLTTMAGSMTSGQLIDAVAGKGTYFDNNDQLTAKGFWCDGNPVTFTFWEKVNTAEVGNVGPTLGNANVHAYAPYGGTLYWRYVSVGDLTTSFGASQLDRWLHVSLVGDAGRHQIYYDATSVASNSAAATSTSNSFYMGGGGWVGRLDEVRVANVARSTDWIWAEFQNMTSNSQFNTFADAVTAGNPNLPSIANVAATGITENVAWLNGTLSSTGTAETAVTVYWGDNDATTNGAVKWDHTNSLGTVTVVPSNYTYQITSLPQGTTHYFNFYAENASGGVWAATGASQNFRTLGPPDVNNSTGATYIGVGTGTVNGVLVTDGGAAASVYICWGTNDFGAPTSAWPNVVAFGVKASGSTVSTNLTGLLYGLRYWYRTYATNSYGEAIAAATNFVTSAPTGAAAGPPVVGSVRSFWLDANQAATMLNGSLAQASAGEKVDTWKNADCLPQTVRQTTDANRPTLTAGVFGSLPALYFDGSARYMLSQAGVYTNTTKTATIFMSLKQTGSQDSYGGTMSMLDALGSQDYDGNNRFVPFLHNGADNNSMYTWEGGVGVGLDNAYAVDGSGNSSPFMAVSVFNQSASAIPSGPAANKRYTYIQDSTGVLASTNNTTGTDSAFSINYFSVGSRYRVSGENNENWNGYIGEVIVYNAALNDADRGTIQDYLYNKWVNGIIPSGGASVGITNTSATSVSATSATLNGTLTGSNVYFQVYAYWGTVNGTNNAAGLWANTNFVGSYSLTNEVTSSNIFYAAASGIASGNSYWYTFRATNAETNIWASPSKVFITDSVTIQATGANPTEEGGYGTFTVYRAASATNTALEVAYTISGTAANGTDYSTIASSVTIPAGATSTNIVIIPVFDVSPEGGETVILTLAAGGYVMGDPSNASMTIAEWSGILLSAQSGNWPSASTWVSASAPPIDATSVTGTIRNTHTVTITAANQIQNDRVIVQSGGTLTATAGLVDAFKDGTIVLDGGTVVLQNNTAYPNWGGDFKIAANSLIQGYRYGSTNDSLDFTAPATLSLTNMAGATDPWIAYFNTFTVTNDATFSLHSAGGQLMSVTCTNVTLGATNTLTVTGSAPNSAVTLNGNNAGMQGTLTVASGFPGTVTLNGSNALATAIINGGTLKVGAAYGAAKTNYVNAGGTLSTTGPINNAFKGSTIILNGGVFEPAMNGYPDFGGEVRVMASSTMRGNRYAGTNDSIVLASASTLTMSSIPFSDNWTHTFKTSSVTENATLSLTAGGGPVIINLSNTTVRAGAVLTQTGTQTLKVLGPFGVRLLGDMDLLTNSVYTLVSRSAGTFTDSSAIEATSMFTKGGVAGDTITGTLKDTGTPGSGYNAGTISGGLGALTGFSCQSLGYATINGLSIGEVRWITIDFAGSPALTTLRTGIEAAHTNWVFIREDAAGYKLTYEVTPTATSAYFGWDNVHSPGLGADVEGVRVSLPGGDGAMFMFR